MWCSIALEIFLDSVHRAPLVSERLTVKWACEIPPLFWFPVGSIPGCWALSATSHQEVCAAGLCPELLTLCGNDQSLTDNWLRIASLYFEICSFFILIGSSFILLIVNWGFKKNHCCYCCFAMARIKPRAWHIIDNTLPLSYILCSRLW
jgi:hypothetical protein